MTTNPWVCPNTPRCEHPGLIHDIYDYDDPRPMCCAEGCLCGQPDSGLPPVETSTNPQAGEP